MEVKQPHCLRPERLAYGRSEKVPSVDELPVAGTELHIAVFPLRVEHRVRLQRVEQWAQTGMVKSPVEMLRRERVRELLGLNNEAVS